MRTYLAAAALAVGLVAPAVALPIADRFSSIAIFGDSLSDTGRAFALTGGAVAGPPYFNGRFSDGPLWSDSAMTGFAPGTAINLAVGGATALANPSFPTNTLDTQRAGFDAAVAFGAHTLGARPLAAIWIGANDGGAGNNPVDVATRVVGEVASLSATYGILDFLVFDLPDFGRWPGPILDGTAATATVLSTIFNATLHAGLDGVEAASPALRITRFDASGLFDTILDDPAAAGMPNGAGPCYIPGLFLCADPTSLVFFDPVHPSSTTHARIAEAVQAAYVPVPTALPLLAFGVVALAGLARRRAA